MLVAILAVARIGTERVLVQIAAREGARRSVVGANPDAASDAARAVFSDGDAEVRIDRAGASAADAGGAGPAKVVTVTVVRRVRPAVPVIEALLPETVELRGAVSMRMEQ